jgi:hypothetical protein
MLFMPTASTVRRAEIGGVPLRVDPRPVIAPDRGSIWYEVLLDSQETRNNPTLNYVVTLSTSGPRGIRRLAGKTSLIDPAPNLAVVWLNDDNPVARTHVRVRRSRHVREPIERGKEAIDGRGW